MNNYLVYMHISPSNKRYIGITCQKPKRRWANGEGYKSNQYFYNAINKYGWDNFQHIIIAKDLDEDVAKWLEIELIREWDTTNQNKGYNITLGGESGNGYKHSEEFKKKMSENKKGENNPMFGKQYTEEQKQTKSKSMMGENNHFYGKHHTEETKRKMSENRKGKNSGENHPFYGEHHTEETKRKMSENHADFSGDNHPQAKKIICLETMEIFDSIKSAINKINGTRNMYTAIKNNKKYKGYTFMYYEDYLKTLE